MLAQRLNDKAVDIIGANPQEYVFSAGDSVGFVFPVYAYVAPQVMLTFAGSLKCDAAYTYAVPTFSNAAGCTLEHFSQTACHLDGGFGIKMPDNMPVFDKVVETRETAIEKLRAAIDRFEVVVKKIENKVREFDILYGPEPETMTWERGIHFLQDPVYKTTSYYVRQDRCISCGLCERVCPAKVIRMENGMPVWSKTDCYVCMACLNHCPTEAIEYGPFSSGKFRYLFKGFDLSKY